MVSINELKELVLYQYAPESRILSLYLNVDQTRAENLNRGFERTLKNLMRRIVDRLDDRQRISFLNDATRLERYVQEYRPDGKLLVVFSNAARDFFWSRTMQVEGPSEIYWETRPYIRPLIEVQDEFPRYGVILTDRGQARLFTVALGEIEEDRQTLAGSGVRRFESPGRDRIRSQMNFQRKAEEHAKWHLKAVANLMDRLLNDFPFDRLILAGPTEAVSELKTLLPERLKERVVGTLSLPIQASGQEILEGCKGLMVEQERANERANLERLFTGAGKKQMAVLGLEDTVRAVMERRVQMLMYADSLQAQGSECPTCGSLFTDSVDSCNHCGSEVDRVPAFVERIVERITEAGGAIDMVRENAADRLNAAGGIGAILRF